MSQTVIVSTNQPVRPEGYGLLFAGLDILNGIWRSPEGSDNSSNFAPGRLLSSTIRMDSAPATKTSEANAYSGYEKIPWGSQDSKNKKEMKPPKQETLIPSAVDTNFKQSKLALNERLLAQAKSLNVLCRAKMNVVETPPCRKMPFPRATTRLGK